MSDKPIAKIPTHNEIWKLAGPVILANISVPLLGAVDTAVIGNMDQAYHLAGVAVGSTIIHFIFWSFGFLRMGISGLVAQAYGARDLEEVKSLFARGVFICFGIGIGLWAFQLPLLQLGLTFFDGSEPTDLKASEYFLIRIWSSPVVLFNYCVIGWFIGIQNTRAILLIQLAMNLLNICLDLILVIGFEMGVSGVAIATVISEIVAGMLGLILYSSISKKHFRVQYRQIWELESFKKLLKINFDIFLRTVCLLVAFGFFTSTASTFGDVPLAAHIVLIQFQQFLAFGLDGLAHAAEALTGKFIGSKNKKFLDQTVKVTITWAFIIACSYTIFYFFLGKHIVFILTGIPEVREFALNYLHWIILSPIISVWSFMLDGIFIGATCSREMRNGMAVSLIIFLCSSIIFKMFMGYEGLWVSFQIFMVARALTLLIFYPNLRTKAN